MKDEIYDPHDFEEVRGKQALERKIYLFTCPFCKKESFAMYRNKSYWECFNIKCKAIGVPSKYITKVIVNGQELNIFTPDGFGRLL